MSQATQVTFDARTEIGAALPSEVARTAAALTNISLVIYDNMADVEAEWRAFERTADCTVFQSFAWLASWQQHIGSRSCVTPAIVMGRDQSGALLLILPLAIQACGSARRLTWLGGALNDYNAPLLAPSFSTRVDAARFQQLWQDVLRRLRSHPQFSFDVIKLTRMQTTVGGQPNPFVGLGVARNPNGAFSTQLSGTWDTFYAAKRSSATRRRDRTKLKKLSEIGEVALVEPRAADERAATLETLMTQKGKAFAAMGVANIFERPGHREFYRSLVANESMQDQVHVSRLDVGSATAAVNVALVFRGSYYHLLASYFDGEVARFGPGAAHLHHLMRHAISRGYQVFDFTIGDEPYKRDWSDTEIRLFDHVSAVTLRGWPAALQLIAVCHLKHWIKQTPAMWSIASRARALTGRLRR